MLFIPHYVLFIAYMRRMPFRVRKYNQKTGRTLMDSKRIQMYMVMIIILLSGIFILEILQTVLQLIQ